MFTIAWAFEWLAGAAVMSLLLSTLGSVAVLCCREPVRRMRMIVLTLGGCVLAPALAFLPGLPRWSLRLLAPTPRLETTVATALIPGDPARIPSREIGRPATAETPMTDFPSADNSTAGDDDVERRSVTASEPDVVSLEREIAAPSSGSYDTARAPTGSAYSAGPQPAATGVAPESRATAFDSRPAIVGLYFAGLAGFAGWWLAGLVGLRRLLRTAQPAPESCRGLLRQVAGPAGDNVRLLVAGRAAQPFTFGWLRPVIVLPAEMCRDTGGPELQSPLVRGEAEPRPVCSTPELRWSLAHEWAHVVRGDVRLWSLAGLVRTVYFYQPLCWWLRAQLRLCQDYLADAAASQETSPETYAEFLATRAAGRPLAIGLGIAGGKSDLYRRVAMLVRNRSSLETHCPRWWSATAVGAAIVLVFVTAICGGRPQSAAAEGPPRGTATADIGKKSGAAKPNPAKAAAEPPKSGPAEAEIGAPDGNLQKLLDGLFGRAAAIKSGRFTANVNWEISKRRGPAPQSGTAAAGPAAPAGMMMPMMAGTASRGGMGPGGSPFGGRANIELVVSGESWRLRPGPDGEDVVVNHAGRLLTFRDKPAPMTVQNAGLGYGLTIRWAAAAGDAASSRLPIPLRAGTIWYPECLPYLREHAAGARLGGKARVNDVETQIVEWRIPAADAGAVFVEPESLQGLLAGGGTYRVYVSPQLDYALARIECIDRFGTSQSTFDFFQFKKLAAGISFPHRIQIREGARERTIDVLKVANINERIEDREFVLPVPPGTEVEDVRPHGHDTFGGRGERIYDAAKHPLRRFTTGAEYPEGLPAAMLEEMDRDVLSPAEVRAQQTKYAAQLARMLSGGNTPAKKSMSYGGKSFEQWRQVLLDDLEPKTRIQALAALAAFAGNGYADDVVAAIADSIKTSDDSAEPDVGVQNAASIALVRCGKAGVAMLEAQLASQLTPARLGAVQALAQLAATTDMVVPPLLKAVNDPDGATRASAYQALATHHLTAPGVADKLAMGLRDEFPVRYSILRGLGDSKAPADDIVRQVAPVLDDEDRNVYAIAAAIFAARAPVSEENARALEKAVLDSGSWGRYTFVVKLKEQQSRVEVRPELVVPILITLLESRESYADLPSGEDIKLARTSVEIIGKMIGKKGTEAAIPVLIKLINEELPIGRVPQPVRVAARRDADEIPLRDPTLVLTAAETLGQFGPAAKDAIPALKWLLEPGRVDRNGLQLLKLETVRQWQARIQSIIDRVESGE